MNSRHWITTAYELTNRMKREIAWKPAQIRAETVRRYTHLINLAIERHTLCKCQKKRIP